MERRRFVRNSALLIGGSLLAQKQLLASVLQQDPWKIKMLRNNIGIFTEKGGTIAFLVGNDGITVVDAEFPEQSQHLIDTLKNQYNKPFRTLINTHHHGDHTAGNISFKGMVDHVLAHENSLKNQKNVAVAQKTEDKQLYPDQTYGKEWCQDAGKEKICLTYFGPAHTDGDSYVHFQHANIVHMGDLMFNRRHPFVDRSAGASIKGWMQVLEQGQKKFDKKTLFVFGHAGDGFEVTGSLDDLAKFGDYFGNLLKFTESEIKAGKSKEEFLKATTLPFASEWKGDGLQRPLAAAWDELSQPQ